MVSLSTAQLGAQTSSVGSDGYVATLAVLFALALLVITALIVAVVVLVVMMKRKQTYSKGHAQLNADHLYKCIVTSPRLYIFNVVAWHAVPSLSPFDLLAFLSPNLYISMYQKSLHPPHYFFCHLYVSLCSCMCGTNESGKPTLYVCICIDTPSLV